MSDRISISGLQVMAVVGVLAHERQAPQPLRIDLVLETDLRDAGRSDELPDTVDYGEVAERVATVVAGSKDVLLERLAERVAETVVGFTPVDAVEVTLAKLRPPLAVPVDTAAVQIRRGRAELDVAAHVSHEVIVALGSNLGDRQSYLRFAVAELGEVGATSQVFETEPVGGPEGQGAYLNMVAVVDTPLDPYAFLRRCNRIELQALRQRVVPSGPRTLDIDVLFFDDVVIDSPELMLPHPRLAERRFVLAPLAEVAPERCPDGWDTRLPPLRMAPRGPLVSPQ